MSESSNGASKYIDTLIETDALTLQLDTPIRRAAAELAKARVSSAPVTDDSGVLRGVLTQKDCFRPALQASYYQEWKGSVHDFMSTELVTFNLGTDMVSVAEAFLQYPYRAFPVLDGNRLVGMLSRENVFSALTAAG